MKGFSNATLAVVLTALMFCSAYGQQKQGATPQPALALEVSVEKGPPSYMAVAPAGSKSRGSTFARFGRILSWKAADNSQPVSAVRVVPVAEADAVRVTVSVLLGQNHGTEKAVANYLIHGNEQISTPELAGFGVQPIDLKVVPLAKPPSLDPPAATNNTSSIEMVGVKPDGSLLATFIVTVKNLAPKRVLALDIKIFTGKNWPIFARPQAVEGRGLIEPGATYEFRVAGGGQRETAASGGQRETAASGTVPLAPTAFTINAVIYDDGSYEGDDQAAADYLTIQAGYWLQLKRVAALLDAASSAPGSDLRTLWAQVTGLAETATQDEVLTIPPKYVFPAGIVQFNAVGDFKLGARRVKQLVLEDIRTFEKAHPPQGVSAAAAGSHSAGTPATPDEVRAWLAKATERYSGWVSRM
jgi:hypothetical protein